MRRSLLSFAYVTVVVSIGVAFVLGGLAYTVIRHTGAFTLPGTVMIAITVLAFAVATIITAKELLFD